MTPSTHKVTLTPGTLLVLAVIIFSLGIGLLIIAASAVATVQAAAVPTATACTGALARFRADAPAAQLTRAAPISKTSFIVVLPINQPGWAQACASGYWIETKYLEVGIANATSTLTPTLRALTQTATPKPSATLTPITTSTPTQVTGTQSTPGVWITINGDGASRFCEYPCHIDLKGQP